MTVDELIELCDALLVDAGATIEGLRKDSGELLAGLDDQQFLLAVRFIAGERPLYTQGVELAAAPPRRERKLVPLDEDEAARRLAELEALDETTPGMGPQEAPYTGPVDIGDGVTLGL